MTQYITDFSEYTSGVQPSGWTLHNLKGREDLEVVFTVTVQDSNWEHGIGKRLFFNNADLYFPSDKVITCNALDNSIDVDILVLVSGNSILNDDFALWARGKDFGTSECYGYSARFTQRGSWFNFYRNDGSSIHAPVGVGSFSASGMLTTGEVYSGIRYWMRFNVKTNIENNVELKFKVWEFGNVEPPGWFAERVDDYDSKILTSGAVGIGGYNRVLYNEQGNSYFGEVYSNTYYFAVDDTATPITLPDNWLQPRIFGILTAMVGTVNVSSNNLDSAIMQGGYLSDSNKYLAGVRIYIKNFYEASRPIRFAVYSGGALSDPTGATLLADIGKISDIVKGQWNTVVCNQRVLIPANQVLWFAMKAEAVEGAENLRPEINSNQKVHGNFDPAHNHYIIPTILKDPDVAFPSSVPSGGTENLSVYSRYWTAQILLHEDDDAEWTWDLGTLLEGELGEESWEESSGELYEESSGGDSWEESFGEESSGEESSEESSFLESWEYSESWEQGEFQKFETSDPEEVPPHNGYLIPITVTPKTSNLSTVHIAAHPIRHPERYYLPMIKAHGSFTRSITTPAGYVIAGDASLTIQDVDNSLRQQWATKSIRKALVDLKIGRERTSFSTEFAQLALREAGVLQQSADGELTLPLRDSTFDVFEQQIPGLMTTADFPNLPESPTGTFMPIIIGNVSSQYGAIPCHLVDTVGFWYSVARHGCRSVAVYRKTSSDTYFHLVTSGVSIITDYPLSDGSLATLIEFDTDQEDAEIRCNVEGTYDPISGQLTNTNFADAFLYFLNMMGFEEDSGFTEIESDAFDAVREATKDILTCRGAVTEQITYGEVISRLQRSSNIDLYNDLLNRVVIKFTTDTATASIALDDLLHFQRGSVKQQLANPAYNRFPYTFAINYTTGKGVERNYDNTEDQYALDEVIPDEMLNLYFIRDADEALLVTQQRSQYLDLDSFRFEATIPLLSMLGQFDLADLVNIRHFGGIKAGGFTAEQFKITDLDFNIDDLTCTLKGIRRKLPPVEVTDPIFWHSCPTAIAFVNGEIWLATTISKYYDQYNDSAALETDALYIHKYNFFYDKWYQVYLEVGISGEGPDWNEPDIAFGNHGNRVVLVLTSSEDNHIEVRIFNGSTLTAEYDTGKTSEFTPDHFWMEALAPSMMLIDSAEVIHILCFKEDGYLYDLHSDDYGVTWASDLIISGISSSKFTGYLAQDADGTLYCLIQYTGFVAHLLKSDDGGETWSEESSILNTDESGEDFTTLVIRAFTIWNDHLYILTCDEAGGDNGYGAKIWKSTDGGVTFTGNSALANDSASSKQLSTAAFLIDGNYLLAMITTLDGSAYESRVYRSSDGASWTLMKTLP